LIIQKELFLVLVEKQIPGLAIQGRKEALIDTDNLFPCFVIDEGETIFITQIAKRIRKQFVVQNCVIHN